MPAGPFVHVGGTNVSLGLLGQTLTGNFSFERLTQTDGSRPFLMELVSGPHDGEAFSSAGFTAISEYVSARGALADAIGPEPATLPGVRVVPWDGSRPEELINRLFEISTGAFARNRFFKPIERAAFLKLYEPIMPLMDPRHIFFAHSADGTLIGFLFGANPILLLLVAAVWGASVVADSAQFSTCVTELGDPQYLGTALTIQTCIGFLITTVSIQMIPVLVKSVTWRFAFMALAPVPVFGVISMLWLRSLPEAVKIAHGRR